MTGKRTKIPSFYTYFTLFAMAWVPTSYCNISRRHRHVQIRNRPAVSHRPLAAMLTAAALRDGCRPRAGQNGGDRTHVPAGGYIGALYGVRGIIATATLMAVWTSVHSGLLSVSNAIALEHLSELGMSDAWADQALLLAGIRRVGRTAGAARSAGHGVDFSGEQYTVPAVAAAPRAAAPGGRQADPKGRRSPGRGSFVTGA